MAETKPDASGCGCLLTIILMIGSSVGGWSLCASRDDRAPSSSSLVADLRSVSESSRPRPVSRFEAQAAWAAARERVIEAEMKRPTMDRVSEAEQRILSPNVDLEAAVCHARWTLSQVPANEGSDRRVAALAKVERKMSRKALAVLRREAMANRMLLCADGTSSPTCECDGNNRGCCSHHGGVIGCERPEQPTIDCPSLTEREHAIEHATALNRFGGSH